MPDQFKINKSITLEEAQIMQKALEKTHIEQKTHEWHIEREALKEGQVPESCELSVRYVHTGEKWNRNNIVLNNIFAFQVAFEVITNYEDPEPQNVEEC